MAFFLKAVLERHTLVVTLLFITIIGLTTLFIAGCDPREFAKHTHINKVTFIHTSDIHGSLFANYHIRDGLIKGGLSRVAAIINQIRSTTHHTFYVHTGDVIQGSAEATFTKGQALVDVMNYIGVQAAVPGNWEFAYGVDRVLQLYSGENPSAPWGAVAANVYYTGEPPYTNRAPGERLLPPYRVVNIGTIRVGLFGCTTNRGPTIVSSNVTKGVIFSDCRSGVTFNEGTPNEVVVPPEIPYLVDLLRNAEQVDLVVMLSEAGLAENLYNAEHFDGIDVIFSSDQHEETNVPIVAKSPDGGTTLIVEEGEDGVQVGELTVEVVNKQVTSWNWVEHDVTMDIRPDPAVAFLVESIARQFRIGPQFIPGRFTNPFNGTRLMFPIDSVIGFTTTPLTRSDFSNEFFPTTGRVPAIVEGNNHDFLADAFRVMTGADIGAIRGFRYVDDIPAGPITYEDIYKLMPIGAQVAVGKISAAAVNNQAENAADSVLNPDVTQWRGGWMFNFSNVTMDLQPYESRVLVGGKNPPENVMSQGRISNIKIGDVAIGDADADTLFSYASYFYQDDPGMVNAIAAKDVMVLTRDGLLPPDQVTPLNKIDGVEVVKLYLETLPGRTITTDLLPFPRINLTEALPDSRPEFGFPVIEPLRGAAR